MIICESCKYKEQCYGSTKDCDYCEDYEEYSFAYVYWTIEDLKQALEDFDLPVTEENIKNLRDRISERVMIENMIAEGWSHIHTQVLDMKRGIFDA